MHLDNQPTRLALPRAQPVDLAISLTNFGEQDEGYTFVMTNETVHLESAVVHCLLQASQIMNAEQFSAACVVCGNAVAGGIDLAGLFPRYINIRRGAIITFVAAWIVQPWQLINRATTFIAVLSSFSVFLAPIIGVMACDYYILRNRKVKLSHLYRTKDSSYWFWHGINWRTIPSWLCGWAPTVGGLIVTVTRRPLTVAAIGFPASLTAPAASFFGTFSAFGKATTSGPAPG